MRYIIAHLIRGEAKHMHEAITQDLVEKFHTFPIHNRIVPHLTLKRWFELDAEAMKKLQGILDTFVTTHSQSDYRLGGFNHFGEDVIYVDVRPSPEMSATARDLMKVLHEVKEMTFDEFDAVEDDFHATLVMRALKTFDYTQVWEYLSKQEGFDFNMKFDNIAIMKRETDAWVVDRIWELPKC
jgi:2'-5' RNA ligase